MSDKPWDGRFSESTDKTVESFTSSIQVDKKLYAHDIDGSVAHSQMLAKQSVITEDDAASLIQGLGKIKRDIMRGNFTYEDSLEDIHMHIETYLTQESGKVAQKLHTARSRNDQVALDVRMYLRDEINDIISGLKQFRKEIVKFARLHADVALPGYTHMQRAQPVLLAHHFMAYYEMFTRDSDRFQDSLKRTNMMPLGAAALAGTTFPIDRDYVAELLEFPDVTRNSIDTVSDRDFVVEFISNASICMMHFSRLSEELILWSTSEFNFIEISDAFTTGSSIMPQKKNPDVAELVRGKTARVYGDLVAILSLMKSLPLSYNRDMQEDKEPMFDAAETLSSCIDIYTRMLPNISVHADEMKKASNEGFLNATDMADYLVTNGMPFREAHGVAGRAVAFALDQKKELHELSLKELKKFSNLIKKDIFSYLTTEAMVDRRTSSGGTSRGNVLNAIEKAESELA